MIIRDIDDRDYEVIKKLNELQDFRLKHIGNSIIDKIVEDKKGAIAYGIVKRAGEAIILVNPERPGISRTKALTELMLYAQMGATTAGCEQLICFVSDARLAGMLEKHFGFIRTRDIVLSKNL